MAIPNFDYIKDGKVSHKTVTLLLHDIDGNTGEPKKTRFSLPKIYSAKSDQEIKLLIGAIATLLDMGEAYKGVAEVSPINELTFFEEEY